MNTELTRKYAQPIPVSASTALHYRQFKNSTSVTSSLGSIPEATDLLKIKADLEGLLPLSEKRIRSLQRDLSVLKKNIKIRDPTETEQRHLEQYEKQEQAPPVRKPSGKNINPAIIEKMQIKQEQLPEETSDMLHTNTLHNKNQLERQLALEALRRKRRRDDDTTKPSGKRRQSLNQEIISRSESPNNIKHKKYDDLLSHRSESPQPKKSQHQKKKKLEAKEIQVDFVRVKPKDQVPILTFWNTIDPYFAPFTEEDRAFLLPKEDDEKYYVIPPLGKHYLDVWSEDELMPVPAMSRSHSPSSSSSSVTTNSYLVTHPVTNEDLLKQDISCGYLTERLLSSLLVDDQIKNYEDEEDDDIVDSLDIIADKSIEETPEDMIQFEERLKRELRYVGLFGEDDVDWNSKEDDEICAELRATAKELKEQYAINEYRKKKLLNVVDNQLQYEQYRHVLDNLDAQVEQCYLKRFRNQKSKKRKAPTSLKSSLSENAVHAMSKRKAWVDALEGIFLDKNMIMPTQSIYDDEPSITTTEKS